MIAIPGTWLSRHGHRVRRGRDRRTDRRSARRRGVVHDGAVVEVGLSHDVGAGERGLLAGRQSDRVARAGCPSGWTGPGRSGRSSGRRPAAVGWSVTFTLLSVTLPVFVTKKV